ncbi:MAG: tetratricopeptide repeat protein, partial [Myxococcales bacterium]|nr:tetratricopeptide repeat protein [Myxococcales bacterium]
ALAIARETNGDAHPEVAKVVLNLAELELAERDYPAARAHITEALEIFETSLGPDHDLVAQCLRERALVARLTGELDRARADYARAREILAAQFGPEAPQVREIDEDLAKVQ